MTLSINRYEFYGKAKDWERFQQTVIEYVKTGGEIQLKKKVPKNNTTNTVISGFRDLEGMFPDSPWIIELQTIPKIEDNTTGERLVPANTDVTYQLSIVSYLQSFSSELVNRLRIATSS